MKNILIIGYGEIGSSLHEVYKDYEDKFHVEIHDPYKNMFANEDIHYEIMNIAIPFIDKSEFVETVSNYIGFLKSKNVIIHSTVQVGTTKILVDKHRYINIVHSPIRGVHPNLKEGIKTFRKYIGSDYEEDCSDIISHFTNLGIRIFHQKGSHNTELLKLLSTTQYGYLIAMYNEMQNLAKQFNENNDSKIFDILEIMKLIQEWNMTYNYGYKKLDMENVTRPILYPTPNDVIGGHCVIPNAKLLKQLGQNDMVDIV